mgnify:CR=1 FL=1
MTDAEKNRHLNRIVENAEIATKRIESLLMSRMPAERQLGRELKAFFDQIATDADALRQ